MSRISAAACVAGLVAGLVLAAPMSAHAKSVTLDDGTGDVWTQVVDEESGDLVWVQDPVDNADLTRTVVKHTKKAISITASYVSLVKDSDFNPGYSSWFKLDDGREGWLAVDAWEGKAYTWLTVQKEPGGKWDKRLECPDLAAKWHWATDTFTASIPRSCFGDPKWLRFHGAAWREPVDYQNDDRAWTDNAHNDEPETSPWKPYTGRIKAG